MSCKAPTTILESLIKRLRDDERIVISKDMSGYITNKHGNKHIDFIGVIDLSRILDDRLEESSVQAKRYLDALQAKGSLTQEETRAFKLTLKDMGLYL